MTPSTSDRDRPLLEQLVRLTDAIKELAEHPRPALPSLSVAATTDADRIRQRVTFGYQVLGTLMGRVSSAGGDEFDVRVVRAARARNVIAFEGLPPGAHWVELRSGTKVEVLRIRPIPRDPEDHHARDDRQDDDSQDEAWQDDAPQEDREDRTVAEELTQSARRGTGFVRPGAFDRTEPIGSIVLLRTARGPLVAFGPRLGPVRSDSPVPQRT
jgi:hypothetical protein